MTMERAETHTTVGRLARQVAAAKARHGVVDTGRRWSVEEVRGLRPRMVMHMKLSHGGHACEYRDDTCPRVTKSERRRTRMSPTETTYCVDGREVEPKVSAIVAALNGAPREGELF